MIRVGIQSELDFRWNGPITSPPTASTMPRASDSRTTGKAQITSITREIDGVGEAAVEARQQAEDDGQDRGDDRRDDADEEGGAAAVEEADHLVAAEVAVGAEEELAAGGEELRADRFAARFDHFLDFAALVEFLQRVGLVRAGVGDVVGPDRGEQTAGDDQEEDAERDQRELVAPQAPPGDRPRAAALTVTARSPSTSATSSGSPVTVPCEAVPESPGTASTSGFSESGDTSAI